MMMTIIIMIIVKIITGMNCSLFNRISFKLLFIIYDYCYTIFHSSTRRLIFIYFFPLSFVHVQYRSLICCCCFVVFCICLFCY